MLALSSELLLKFREEHLETRTSRRALESSGGPGCRREPQHTLLSAKIASNSFRNGNCDAKNAKKEREQKTIPMWAWAVCISY